MKSIHQFHSGSAVGDAVTNSMFLIQDILLKFGFVSEIYAEHVAEQLAVKIKKYTEYQPSSEDVLLIHHSMGHELTEWIINLAVTKFLIYHNITPVEFFPADSPFYHYSKVGRDQLFEFLPYMKASIAVSEINAQELKEYGYEDVSIIPLLFDIAAIQRRHFEPVILQEYGHVYTILFVGRVSPNKCQGDLVDIATELQQMTDKPFELVLVGAYDSTDPYYQDLMENVQSSGLENKVLFTGKVSDEELISWYKVADVFVCMSEHEGFGVPLIEAMTFDVPVVAYKSSNIPFTMDGAGIVIGEKEPIEVAALLLIVHEDRILKRAIISSQRQRLAELSREKLTKSLSAFLRSYDVPIPEYMEESVVPDDVHYQVEGPYETSYSLALVNRELTFALDQLAPSQVGLFATEGDGDYEPDLEAIVAIPGLTPLSNNGRKRSHADVVIRNLYPPRVADMDGFVNLLYFAWEETELPTNYVDDFNCYLDGLPVLSSFVKKILIDNGVFRPIISSGCGFDHIQHVTIESYKKILPDGYKFLHISSCFPRKGIDVLLEAFSKTFKKEDDVSLVIKTFPNIHNTVNEQVKIIQQHNSNCPTIEIIEDDLPIGQIADLYRQCQAFVAPSRGEGFGLPMAEAMWHGLPVITTGFGGQVDFCTDQTSWLIEYSFALAKSHLSLFDSVWVEPDTCHLGRLMHEVWSADETALQPRLLAAKKLLEEKFTWRKCAERLVTLERKIIRKKIGNRKKINLGWVSSWNVKCGIASYSNFLIEELQKDNFNITIFASSKGKPLCEDSGNVERCWSTKDEDVDQLIKMADQSQLDVLVIQFSYSFYSLPDLGRLILWAKRKKIIVLVMFHITKDLESPLESASLKTIHRELAQADRLLVHGVGDLNRLKEYGLVQNATLFPHGVLEPSDTPTAVLRKIVDIQEGALVIASYGFLLPHKGIEQLIEAFSILKKSHCNAILLLVNALYPEHLLSRELRAVCIALIEKYQLVDSVVFETNFLSDDESLNLLGAADLLVFSYQQTNESSSAAVRYALALDKPVAVTPLEIFSDVKALTHVLPGTTPELIASGVEELLRDPEMFHNKDHARRKWITAHRWSVLGKRLRGMCKGLLENRCN